MLFSRLSGYAGACLKALSELHGVDLLVIRTPQAENAPFEDRYFDWIGALYDRSRLRASEMSSIITEFAPDALYVSGWFDRDYLRIARQQKQRGTFVVAGVDRQWLGTPRQHLSRLVAPRYLHSAFHVLWTAGERQRQLASRLGYRGDRCWSGVYACDWDSFAGAYYSAESRLEKAFLYVGRYIQVKGIQTLLEAYDRYRKRASEPWSLICSGAGEFGARIRSQAGVVDVGFTQPDRLPELMATASAFVLPSLREPWGVVVQEAAAAGLPLICSDACGAAVHLLQDEYNGFLVESGNPEQLARSFERMASLTSERWDEMSRNSHELSRQFTPRRWADTFVSGVERHRKQRSET